MGAPSNTFSEKLYVSKHFLMDYNTMETIFHFCSILILLSALMFESGAAIEKEPLAYFKEAAVNATDAKAEEEKIAASQYLLVVFVITIVVVSTLYFFAALIGELSRSCPHFLKVNRSRKKD